MNGFVAFAADFVLAVRQAHARKWSFLFVFVCAFTASLLLLASADLLPESPVNASVIATVEDAPLAPATPIAVIELPTKIEIPAIKLAVHVSNPDTTKIELLDQALLSGAVRYPTSAKLGEEGNVVLFGHSSYLPVVQNQAYKAFNGIQKLKAGDRINVLSKETVYVYQVRGVAEETTSAAIDLSVTGRVLTLSTCDSFGAKSDRFVVTADFVESHPAST